MTKLKTISIPCKGKTREMTGTVAILPIGDRKVRFLIERKEDGSLGSLTHNASGFAFARSLNRFAVSHLVRHGTYARRPSPRELAEAAIAGRRVYNAKQLRESLEGQVEIEHISENSFGHLAPDSIYAPLKLYVDVITALAALVILSPFLLLVAHVVEKGYLDAEQCLLRRLKLDRVLLLDSVVSCHEASLHSLACEFFLLLHIAKVFIYLFQSALFKLFAANYRCFICAHHARVFSHRVLCFDGK
jgi:hypothetical protein